MNVKLGSIETEAVLATKTGELAEIRARHLSTPKKSLDHYLQSRVKISLRTSKYHAIKTFGEVELSLKTCNNRRNRVGIFTPRVLCTQCPRCRKVCGTRDGLDSGKKKKICNPCQQSDINYQRVAQSLFLRPITHGDSYVSPTPCCNSSQWARAS